jgi:selenocysteine lyase/cysteine desulfurase
MIPTDPRELFDIPPEVTYLNCASMSPQMRAVTAAGMEAMRAKASPWELKAADWFTGAERLRALAAAVLGTDADGVALVPSVSYGIAVAAANVELGRGQSVVLLDREFPSNFYRWAALAEARGARLRLVRREEGQAWTEAVLEAIDRDTAVVSVPPCHWTDGARVDLVRVGEKARAVGASLVVDASQALGAYPLDLAAIQPDFLVSVGYKWLLGPYGLGYFYAAPRWRERGIPIEDSWLTRAGSEDFASLVDYRDEYRPGARRFDMGEFPHFVLAPMAAASVSAILDWGVAEVQRRLSALTERAARAAAARGWPTLPAGQRVGHIIGLRVPGGDPVHLSRALAAERIYVGVRGDSLRVSPHLYNSEEDVDRLFAAIG